MNLKKNLCASICVNVLVLGIFLIIIQQMDAVIQLLFSFIPIILSLIVCVIINRNQGAEKDKYLQCAGVCAGLNCINLIVEYVCISAVADVNNIYEVSQKYQSEYITISENNSPIFSIAVFSAASFILHYFALKKLGTKKL